MEKENKRQQKKKVWVQFKVHKVSLDASFVNLFFSSMKNVSFQRSLSSHLAFFIQNGMGKKFFSFLFALPLIPPLNWWFKIKSYFYSFEKRMRERVEKGDVLFWQLRNLLRLALFHPVNHIIPNMT
jgi:hypothetical protein